MKLNYLFLAILGILVLAGCQKIGLKESPNLVNSVVDIGTQNKIKGKVKTEIQTQATTSDAIEIEQVETLTTKAQSAFLDYSVAFVSQAPYAIWDVFHQETCEEASMIMVVNFFNDQPLDKHIMEHGLFDLVSWQEARGYKVDLDADEVVEILDQYFNQPANVLTDISVERIISELDKGNLLIAPAAGRNLGNPYFTAPGPTYHMLVIRGYDNETGEFITNDPGTRRGDALRYKYSRLLDAIAEWDHNLAVDGMTQAEMEQGRKVLILVNPVRNY